MVSFDHRDEGTPEDVWAALERWDSVPPLELVGVRHAVVVAAHPDDESLGAGGLIARLHTEGAQVTVVLATLGEASHSIDMSERRECEFEDAVGALAPGSTLVSLGLPDGGLREHRGELTSAIADIASGTDLVVAPWRGDGHRDHRVAGEAAAEATRGRVVLLEYPIWLWHWATPDDAGVPWDRFTRLTLEPPDRDAKLAAIVSYESQLEHTPGDEPILHAGMLAHFGRDWETFVRAPA